MRKGSRGAPVFYVLTGTEGVLPVGTEQYIPSERRYKTHQSDRVILEGRREFMESGIMCEDQRALPP